MVLNSMVGVFVLTKLVQRANPMVAAGEKVVTRGEVEETEDFLEDEGSVEATQETGVPEAVAEAEEKDSNLPLTKGSEFYLDSGPYYILRLLYFLQALRKRSWIGSASIIFPFRVCVNSGCHWVPKTK